MDRSRQQLLIYISQVEAQLKALYGNTYAEVLKLAAVRNAIESGAQFTWKGNPAAERQLNAQLQQLSKQAGKTIQNGITGGWKEGESQVKDEILERFGKKDNAKEVNNVMEDAVKQQRAKGMNAHAFGAEKRGGINVSKRVWNLAGNAKKELEVIIQNGILEGKSADEVTRGLKDYLNEPDRLYRRVKNKETGEMELSSAAKEYKPGRGVYRSAYKNALRLAITEINAGYRRAEWESYQSNPLIIGYRIELSNNHTHIVNGKKRTLYDICDEMVGQYPKSFLWTGWHPHCRCRMVPILISDADFKARQQARKAGNLEEWRPKGSVSRPPKGFYDWLKDNKDRIATAKKKGSLPYFLQDNNKFTSSKRIKTQTEITDIQSRWNTRTTGNKHNDHLLKVKEEFSGLSNAINTFISTIQSEIKAGSSLTKVNALVSKLNNKVEVKQSWDIRVEENRLSTLLDDVKGAKAKFGLAETQNVFKAVENKLKEWESLTPEEQKKKLAFEVDWVAKQKKYDTWEVAEAAYKKQLAKVEHVLFETEVDALISTAKLLKPKANSNLAKLLNNKEVSQAYVEKVAKEMNAMTARRNKAVKGDFANFTDKEVMELLTNYETETVEAADKAVRGISKTVWKSLTLEERNALTKYTGTFNYLNEPLRGKPFYGNKTPNADHVKDLPVLTGALNKFSMPRNTVVRRGVDNWVINELGYGLDKVKPGDMFVDKAFLSTAMHREKGFLTQEFNLVILVPKGSKGFYAEPFSQYTDQGKFKYSDNPKNANLWDGVTKETIKSEQEWIGQRGSQFKVLKKDGKTIYLQLVGQLK